MQFRLLPPFVTILPLIAALNLQPQHFFSNSVSSSSYKIPTIHESAVLARRILHLTPFGTLSTIFPSSPQTSEQRPTDVGGTPIGLMDYIADCEGSGDPTILSISIATSFKNVAAGSNISLSLTWTPPTPPYSPASLPRFALLGYLEPITEEEVQTQDIATCFTKSHPDAKWWLPGNEIHHSEWVRLVVEEVYWVGGFGDRAYIGWIPIEEWRNVTKEEWKSVTLPGEKKGWREWISIGEWKL